MQLERQIEIGTSWQHPCDHKDRTCQAYFKTEPVVRPDGQPAKRIVGSFCRCEPKRAAREQ